MNLRMFVPRFLKGEVQPIARLNWYIRYFLSINETQNMSHMQAGYARTE